MKRDEFAAYHPLVSFLYFVLVLAFTMVFTHPVMLLISLGCAAAYGTWLKGKKAARMLLYLLPVCLLTLLLNPVFNHEGATILLWLPSGNPLTKEAFFFGGAAALMLMAAVAWFFCLNEVLTSDKFIWLFGRIIPALSMVLSMVLRFVPRFTERMRMVSAARRAAGYQEGEKPLQKIRHGVTVLSVVVTWALENAIETADGMKSRGYGLEGRTAFSVYRWEKRDSAAVLFLLYCAGYILVGSAVDGIRWQYYPMTGGEWRSPFAISIFLAYLALCIMPLYINGKEAAKWRSLLSEI